MSRSDLLQIAENNLVAALDADDSRRVYDYFADQIQTTQHGERFEAREFPDGDTLHSQHPLNVAQSYFVTRDGSAQFQRQVAETALSLIMPKEDGDELVKAMGQVYYSDQVQTHLEGKGSIAWVSGHYSYADMIAELAALSLARLDAGEASPNEAQDVFISRLVGLFKHPLIEVLYDTFEQEHQGGVILEDVILPNGNAIQTFPATAGGRANFVRGNLKNKRIRTASNRAVLTTIESLIALGGRSLHLSATGTEAKLNPDNGRLKEQTIGRGTVSMLTSFNDNEGESDKLLVIPITLLPDPFRKATKDIPVNPQPTPFAIHRPRFLTTPRQTHAMLLEVTEAANLIKPSGVPLIEYDPPGPDMSYHPELPPELVYIHCV